MYEPPVSLSELNGRRIFRHTIFMPVCTRLLNTKKKREFTIIFKGFTQHSIESRKDLGLEFTLFSLVRCTLEIADKIPVMLY